jgi:dUTPase
MAESIIKFLKTRDVKSPTRGYQTDAGIDFYVPKFVPTFIKDLKEKNPAIFAPKENPYSGNLYMSSNGCVTLTNGSEKNAPSVTYDLKDDNDTLFKFDETKGKPYFLLMPHSRVNIPSGIKSKMLKEGRALIAANKSGVATKQGLIFAAQVVDYSYTGEIHIGVINTSTKVVRIYEEDKLIQFVETPVYTSKIEAFEEIAMTKSDIEEFWGNIPQDRKDGGFGSTDKTPVK